MWRYYRKEKKLTINSIPNPYEALKFVNFDKPRTLYWARTWDDCNTCIHVIGYVEYLKRLSLEDIRKYELIETHCK